MFTGIIEGIGEIKSIIPDKGGFLIEIFSSFPLEDTKIGDSISVDGVCLTVEEIKKNRFKARLSPETIFRSTFKYKKPGDFVNLERALKLGDRLGGHLVSGHVDGIGKILEIKKIQGFFQFKIEIPSSLAIYIIEKGSIAIDGISLTINSCKKNVIELMIIPHTFSVTNLKYKKPKDFVNVEIDMIAKMIYKWFSSYKGKDFALKEQEEEKSQDNQKITVNFLKEHGFM